MPELDDLVMVTRAEAEWIRDWKSRCTEGRRVLRIFAVALLAIAGAIGTMSFAVNQLGPALRTLGVAFWVGRN